MPMPHRLVVSRIEIPRLSPASTRLRNMSFITAVRLEPARRAKTGVDLRGAKLVDARTHASSNQVGDACIVGQRKLEIVDV